MSDPDRAMLIALLLTSCAVGPPDSGCSLSEQVFAWTDLDGDGYGAADAAVGWVCRDGPGLERGLAPNSADCDDQDPLVHPYGAEACDGVDNDCDGVVDEDFVRVPWFRDADGDGYGDPEQQSPHRCIPPEGSWVRVVGDCDDRDAERHPGAAEVCNRYVDDDCNGLADDRDPGVDPETFTTWYFDADQDGFGDPATTVQRCHPPLYGVAQGDDCDDLLAEVSPGAREVCDGLDNDCDGLVDDDDDTVDPDSQQALFADVDGDGFGDPINPVYACAPEPGRGVTTGTDCDDRNPGIGQRQFWYGDEDGDGWGAGPYLGFECLPPAPGAVGQNGDCDDDADWLSPGAPEICDNGVDENCDGLVDCEDAGCVADLQCAPECVDDVLVTGVPSGGDSTTEGQPDHFAPSCGGPGAPEVVLQWVADEAGTVTIDTEGSGYDALVAVYDGCEGAELACNDDGAGSLQARVELVVEAGQVLLIVVDGYDGAAGPFTLQVN